MMHGMATVHSILPAPLTAAVDAELRAAGVAHRAHGDDDPVGAATAAAGDATAAALIGPYRSADVAEAVAATAPAGLPLLAPVATWAGVTRADEPGGPDDPADHRGTVRRMIARDTEVARRIAAHVRALGHRALVLAGRHDYGVQLDAQLRLAGLPRTVDPRDAGLIVLCALPGGDETRAARDLAPLPVIAFDAVQGSDLGAGRDIRVALPYAPLDDEPFYHLRYGAESARRAAALVAAYLRREGGRPALRDGFDEHGDPLDPPVWLWRAQAGWTLRADCAL
jgi:hypothetical protein